MAHLTDTDFEQSWAKLPEKYRGKRLAYNSRCASVEETDAMLEAQDCLILNLQLELSSFQRLVLINNDVVENCNRVIGTKPEEFEIKGKLEAQYSLLLKEYDNECENLLKTIPEEEAHIVGMKISELKGEVTDLKGRENKSGKQRVNNIESSTRNVCNKKSYKPNAPKGKTLNDLHHADKSSWQAPKNVGDKSAFTRVTKLPPINSAESKPPRKLTVENRVTRSCGQIPPIAKPTQRPPRQPFPLNHSQLLMHTVDNEVFAAIIGSQPNTLAGVYCPPPSIAECKVSPAVGNRQVLPSPQAPEKPIHKKVTFQPCPPKGPPTKQRQISRHRK